MKVRWAIYAVIVVLGLVVDQVSKWWARTDALIVGEGQRTVIPHWVEFVHRENPGAAFSMLANQPESLRIAFFVALAIVVTCVLSFMVWRRGASSWMLVVGAALTVSGAVGNGIDRAVKPMFGMSATVTDFVRVYTDSPQVQEWLGSMFGAGMRFEYPTFNVADILLFVGVAVLIIQSLVERRTALSDKDDDEVDDEVDDEEHAAS